ncbi:MAG: hypothetical protein ACMXYG_04620 [Candidatus Woesearchaeota archaeon]
MKRILLRSLLALNLTLAGCTIHQLHKNNPYRNLNFAKHIPESKLQNASITSRPNQKTLEDIIDLNEFLTNKNIKKYNEYYQTLKQLSVEELIDITTRPIHAGIIMNVIMYRTEKFYDEIVTAASESEIEISSQQQKRRYNITIAQSDQTTCLDKIRDGEVFSCFGYAISTARMLYDNGYPPYILLMIEDNNYGHYISHVVHIIKSNDQLASLGLNSTIGFSESNTLHSITEEMNQRGGCNFSRYILFDLDQASPGWQTNTNITIKYRERDVRTIK